MISAGLALVVALEHVLFMVFETFLWTTPKVRKRFGQTAEQAETTRVVAANQGVYNGALAAGIVWAQVSGELAARAMLLVFVVVVGVYGAASAKRSILFIQSLPAAIALALGWANL